MDEQIERRNFEVEELRVSDDDAGKITGHAAVFNKLSRPIGGSAGFQEKIDPGAFRNSITTDDIRALWNHDPSALLGRNKAGTLRLSEDKKGLAFEIDAPDTQLGRDLQVSIRRGDVDSMSFGFIALKDEWSQPPGEIATRTLQEVRLLDVSPVTFPAYPSTDVAVRSMEAWQAEMEAGRAANEVIRPRLPEQLRRQRMAELE